MVRPPRCCALGIACDFVHVLFFQSCVDRREFVSATATGSLLNMPEPATVSGLGSTLLLWSDGDGDPASNLKWLIPPLRQLYAGPGGCRGQWWATV
jgi:hypothetical protein